MISCPSVSRQRSPNGISSVSPVLSRTPGSHHYPGQTAASYSILCYQVKSTRDRIGPSGLRNPDHSSFAISPSCLWPAFQKRRAGTSFLIGSLNNVDRIFNDKEQSVSRDFLETYISFVSPACCAGPLKHCVSIHQKNTLASCEVTILLDRPVTAIVATTNARIVRAY